MATYCATTRTNYFRVKDAAAFQRWCQKRGLRFWTKDGDPKRYAFEADREGGWPPFDDETDEEIDLPAELAPHLHPQDVAVLVQIGNEKLRYLTGEAVAVSERGRIAIVDLDDIYDLALKNAPHGACVTEAAY